MPSAPDSRPALAAAGGGADGRPPAAEPGGRPGKTDSPLSHALRVLGPEISMRLEAARAESARRLGRRVVFYSPGFVRVEGKPNLYPAVSITGARCDLGCAHCGGKLLAGMLLAETPLALVALARRLAAEGALGMLVSGGCDGRGRLPWARYLDALGEIKKATGLRLSVHAGLVDEETARGLARAGVDAVLFDVVGSDECLRDVFHLRGGLPAVEASMDALAASGANLVPHLVLGLCGDDTRGELRALEMIARRGTSRVSFVILMPLRGTALEGARPPALASVAKVLARARERLPDVVHSLGCARPRDRYGAQVEAVALAAGVNALAFPTSGAESAAVELGLEIVREDVCCCL